MIELSLMGSKVFVYDGLELKQRKQAQYDVLFKTWQQLNPVAQEVDMALLLFAESESGDGLYACNPDTLSKGHLPIRDLAAWVHIDGHMTWVPITRGFAGSSPAQEMLYRLFQAFILIRGEPVRWSQRGATQAKTIHHAIYDV